MSPGDGRFAWAFENWSMGSTVKIVFGTWTCTSSNLISLLRVNIIKVPCITKKSVTLLGFVVHPYQQPVGLGIGLSLTLERKRTRFKMCVVVQAPC